MARVIAALFLLAASAQAAVDGEKLRQTNCALDIIQAALHIYKGGLQIDGAVTSCKDVQSTPGVALNKKQTACAVDITGLTNSFLGVGAFLAASVTNCDANSNAGAACASTIIGTIGGIAGVVNSGFGMSASCGNVPDRRLEATNTSTPGNAIESGVEERRLLAPKVVAWCVLDVLMVAANIARMGSLIASATTGICPSSTAATCSATVSGILATIFNVGSYLAGVSATCAASLGTVNQKAAGCAGDTLHLVNELAGLASSGSAMSEACVGSDAADNALGQNRRLDPAAAGMAHANVTSVAQAFSDNLGKLSAGVKAAYKESGKENFADMLAMLEQIGKQADRMKSERDMPTVV